MSSAVLRWMDLMPGRNLKTGDAILIEARRVVRFKPSDVLRDQVKEGT